MRGFVPSAVVAVGLLASLSGVASAQQGLRGPGMALGGFNFITEPAIQGELKLDDAQKKKADAFAKKMASRFQTDKGKLDGLDRDAMMKRIPLLAKQHYEEGMKGLGAVLTPQQVDRFDQILFQQRGANAMLEPEIAKTLQLTNEQAKQVASVLADIGNRQKEAVKAEQGNAQAAGPKLQAIAKEGTAKAVAVLKPEQRKTWDRITGRAFEPAAAAEAAPR